MAAQILNGTRPSCFRSYSHCCWIPASATKVDDCDIASKRHVLQGCLIYGAWPCCNLQTSSVRCRQLRTGGGASKKKHAGKSDHVMLMQAHRNMAKARHECGCYARAHLRLYIRILSQCCRASHGTTKPGLSPTRLPVTSTLATPAESQH